MTTKQHRIRISRGSATITARAFLALTWVAGAACTPASAGEATTERAPIERDGRLVVDWNASVFELAARVDEYKDPFVHLRALTMMHLAMHDAINGVSRKYTSFAQGAFDAGADPSIAAAAAAHGVLTSLYPGERAFLDAQLERTTAPGSKDPVARKRGLALGKAAAEAVLAAREGDRSNAEEPYTPSTAPGRHRFVPPFELVYRPAFRNVEPVGLASGAQFRSKPPPALGSAEYANAYEEVRTYGRAEGATRSPDQTYYADFWYELSEIGWNRIARVTWAEQEKRDLWFTARLFALLNAGLMDAYVAGWDSKLHYDFWRPYTAIRAGSTDDNERTAEEAKWEAYCVTPPVQDYPSTHSALGAAGAVILHRIYGRDVPFTMESSSTKPAGQKRSFTSFEKAASENADSRVACGIHFRFATREGLVLGEKVGDYVLGSLLRPIGETDKG